jgi:hypothetical protein
MNATGRAIAALRSFGRARIGTFRLLVLLRLVQWPIRGVTRPVLRRIPREPSLIAFGAASERFADNPAYSFLALVASPSLRCVCISGSAATVERLRAAGLSAAKAAAVKDLATRTLEGTVPSMTQVRRLSDEEIIERLTTVRGIGRWTVEMLLLFRLGRPDVLPLGDLGVRKGFARTFNRRALLDPLVLHRRAERWRPYRSVASWYLWRALDLERG